VTWAICIRSALAKIATRSLLMRPTQVSSLPELLDDHEHEGARKALRWVLERVGREGIVTKILALRFLLHFETESMECVGKEYGVSRATISKYCTMFAVIHSECTALGPTRRARLIRTHSVKFGNREGVRNAH
jgi:hypothetical protein